MYTAIVLAIPDDLREAIEQDGTPLPLIEPDEGKAYLVLRVNIGRTQNGVFRAVAQGVNAVGDGDIPSDALFALCMGIEMLAESPAARARG